MSTKPLMPRGYDERRLHSDGRTDASGLSAGPHMQQIARRLAKLPKAERDAAWRDIELKVALHRNKGGKRNVKITLADKA